MSMTRFAPILEHRVLAALLPSAHRDDIDEAIDHLRRELTRRDVASCETWQEAWNLLVGARPGQREGVLRFTAARCRHCRGKRITHRNPGHNLRMTGNASVCGDCRGTGRGQVRQVRALPAVVRDSEKDASA